MKLSIHEWPRRVLLALGYFVLFLLMGACQADEAPSPPSEARTETVAWDGPSITLFASKAYQPSPSWKDGLAERDAPTAFLIPKSLPVQLGNSGNHQASLSYRTPAGEEVTCFYVGGSKEPHPKSNLELAKARQYNFDHCSSGRTAGDAADGIWFNLHLEDGDSEDAAGRVDVLLHLSGNLQDLEPPITPEESVAIRDSFTWSDTVELAETNEEGLPALHYAIVYLEDKDQVDALRQLRIHHASLPLFAEELTKWEGQQGILTNDGDGQGLFVFAIMPAITYNMLRAAALEGNDIFRVIKLRQPPVGTTTPDGSLSYDVLRASGFQYMDLDPETGEPSLEDVDDIPASEFELAPGQGSGKPQYLFNVLKRKLVALIASAVKGAVRLVAKTINLIDRTFTGSARLSIALDVRNTDPFFGRGDIMQRTWGANAGSRVTLPKVRVTARQWVGPLPSIASARTDANGVATMKVTKGKQTGFCVAVENRAAEVTRFLIEAEVCSFPDASGGALQGDTTINLPITHGYFNILAQASEGYAYLRDVVGYTPYKADILVGGLANVLSVIQSGAAITPCLGFPNLGFDLLVSALGQLPVVGKVISAAAPAFAVDMIVAESPDDVYVPLSGMGRYDANHDSRGLTSHEYGHFALCSMLYDEGVANITLTYNQVILDRIKKNGKPPPDADAGYINEAFADFFAGQLTGGVNYFAPPASTPAFGMSYCEATANTCLENNYSDRSSFDAQVARVTTTLHDAFDGPHTPFTNAPGNGDIWKYAPPFTLADVNERAGDGADEEITLPGIALRQLFANAGLYGSIMSQDNFLRGLADTMKAHGYSYCQICKLFARHSDAPLPANDIDGHCQIEPIRTWIGDNPGPACSPECATASDCAQPTECMQAVCNGGVCDSVAVPDLNPCGCVMGDCGICVQGACQTKNLALGAATMASSTYCVGVDEHCYNTSRINDGDSSTALGGFTSWCNDNGSPMPQWVELDFGGKRTFGRIEVYTTSGYEVQDYNLEYWDGSGWITLVSVVGNSQVHRTHIFPLVEAPKLRVIGLTGSVLQPGYVRLNEIEIYYN